MRNPLVSRALALLCLGLAPALHAQSMSVDSLDGPVTQNEINSFVTYIGTINPVVWPNTGSMENQYAQGASGEQIKAMGLMYEISQNTTILNRMIYFCDTLLSQRNDLLAAPNGQRVYWNGKISPAWPGQAIGTTPIYSTSASGDCVGHLANCARLILQTPAIWNTTVPDGNPFGYGGTYLQRAQTYVTQSDYTFSQCFFPDMLTLTNSGLTNVYCYPTGYPYQPGNQYPWNQAMMMTYPLQNLAIAHSILGDNPALLAKYDTLVQTNIGRFFSDSTSTLHQVVTDGTGRQAYDWAYNPSANGGEDSNHGSLDVAGFYRAYDTGRYGVTAAQMTPFANMVCDIMTGTIGTYYHGTVEGADGTGHAASTTYLRSGYFLTAEFRPDQYYNMVSGLHITAPGTTGSIDAFSRLMWIKNRRYLGAADFSLSATPSSQTVNAGGSTPYTATVSALNGFTGTVNLSVSGVPTGATGNFNPTAVTTSGNSTLTVATGTSTAAGTYSLLITGISGSLTHTVSTSLVVNRPPVSAPTFSPAAGSYTSSQAVTISSATGGASIRYTTDGSTPTSTTGTLYSGAVTVSATTTLKAIAYAAGMTDSAVSSATYTITLPQVAAPSFSPGGGTYSTAQSVTISSTTTGASIRYTTDGSTPTSTTGTLYSGAVTIGATSTLKAIAYESGMSDSTVSSATYSIVGTFTITASAGANGTISPTGSVAVTQGANQSFTITPAGGYAVATVTVDGTSAGAVTTYTFSNVQANHTIGATFVTAPTTTPVNDNAAGVTYTGTWTYGAARGLGDYQDDVHYTKTAGDSVSYTFTGTGIDYVTEKNTDEGNIDMYIDGVLQQTVSCTSTSRLVQQVVYSASGLASGSHTFKAVKNSGTFMLLDELIVHNSAPPVTFTITASAGANGAISPTGAVTVNQGANQTFAITPNSGYVVSAVTVDGTSIGAVTTYTFSNVQAAHTISATFQAAPTFTLTASAGANGAISPTGAVVVNQGANQTFAITPNSGYVVSAVTVDGTGVGAVTTYTFSNVQAAHTISATFVSSPTDTNIAPSGTAYGWSAMTAGTANTGKVAHTGLNDNNLTVDVDLDSAGDAVNAWEAAGVIWSSAKSLSSAKFINGTVTSGGDGFLTANCKLQFTTDGSTWTDSGWTISPAYPNSSAASGVTYTFSGTTVSGKLGARVVGQVRTTDTSYHWIVKEVEFIGH